MLQMLLFITLIAVLEISMKEQSISQKAIGSMDIKRATNFTNW